MFLLFCCFFPMFDCPFIRFHEVCWPLLSVYASALKYRFLLYSYRLSTYKIYCNKTHLLLRKKIIYRNLPSLTILSVKRLVKIVAGRVPLANRMPESIASFVCSVSVKALRNSRSCGSDKKGVGGGGWGGRYI